MKVLFRSVLLFVTAALVSCGRGWTPNPIQGVSPAQPSSFIVTLTEEGPNVVATGRGTINTTALVPSFQTSNFAGTEPKFALIFTGPTSFPLNTVYLGLTGPTNFGSGSKTLASSGSGMFVGVSGLSGSIYVPRNYVSGMPLMSTLTWDNATFVSLGVTPGTYVWTWGSGVNAGSFTLQIGPTAVAPEPATLGLLALGLLHLRGISWRGSKRVQ